MPDQRLKPLNAKLLATNSAASRLSTHHREVTYPSGCAMPVSEVAETAERNKCWSVKYDEHAPIPPSM
jgi:hypothetical protein